MDNIERSKITIDRIVEENNTVFIYSKYVKDYDFHELMDRYITEKHLNDPVLVLVNKEKEIPGIGHKFTFIKGSNRPINGKIELYNIGWNPHSEGKKKLGFPHEFMDEPATIEGVIKKDMQITKSTHIGTKTANEVMVSYNNQEFKYYVEIIDLGIGKIINEIRSAHTNPRLRKSEKGKIKKMITNYYTERLNS